MNKSMIFVLAVCLVSVHAFVKRDAPAAAPAQETNYLDDLKDQMKNLQSNIEKTLKDISDPEKAKEFMNQISTVTGLDDFVEKLKPKETPKQ